MSLSRPVCNLKAIEFGEFFAYFHLSRHLKLVTSKMSHGVNKSCITQHVVAQGGYVSEIVRNSQNTA